ncbi:MAG: hypothetical protein HRT45_07755 [Bdellovibrionales bacterium]|nr:hypothetical protein [Bdellovibrionales bacterium]
MKTLLIAILMALPSLSWASVNADFEGYPLCSDMAEMEMPWVYEVFCKSSKSFSRHVLCREAECLVQKHVTHCHPAVQDGVRHNIHLGGLGMFNGHPIIFQNSPAMYQLENALSRYCD